MASPRVPLHPKSSRPPEPAQAPPLTRPPGSDCFLSFKGSSGGPLWSTPPPRVPGGHPHPSLEGAPPPPAGTVHGGLPQHPQGRPGPPASTAHMLPLLTKTPGRAPGVLTSRPPLDGRPHPHCPPEQSTRSPNPPPAAAWAAVRGGPAGLPVFLSRRSSSPGPPHRHLPPEASAGEVPGWPPGPHPLWTQH